MTGSDTKRLLLNQQVRTGEMLHCGLAINAPVVTDRPERRGERTGVAHYDSYILSLESLSDFIVMKTIVYRTTVDDDVPYSAKKFADDVAIYLADPDGWSQHYTFKVGTGGKHIRLCKPHVMKTNGCKDGYLSCATLGGTDIWLNSDRWLHGSPPSKLSLDRYRQYLVTHEMGHSLGYDHAMCPGKGMPAPLMMQQSLGIGECSPNTKITLTDRKAKA